jgi:phospholipid/cholesterol/gamma-HCH transport system substrate-binding protein
METDKRYFAAGLFIIVLAVGIALAFVWLAGTERRDDVRYHVRFTESVSGLALGESVKYHGVDVGNVKSMSLDPADPRMVLVNVSIRKDAPVKTDTRATLKLKGVTGTMFIELNGGTPKAALLLASTPAGEMPEIASEKGSLATVIDQLPRVVEKFTAIEDQAKKVLTDVSGFTSKVKENPSLLLRRPDKDKQPDKPPDK